MREVYVNGFPVVAMRSHRQKTKNFGQNLEAGGAMLTPVSLRGLALHNTGFSW